ncbi:MAG: MaoC family dehydratase N-terminal domain-containing protein [Actinomycetota bacterium]|nr:MaoC family dehydratase N-terminal domain-containing protein [Actinomycetota bacterium]
MTTPADLPENYADVSVYAVEGPSAIGKTWVGHESVREAPYPVNEAQIAYYCSATEDANENYWDPVAAERRHGAIISPPGMLIVWSFPLPWTPSGRPDHSPFLGLEVPLPGRTLINVGTDTTFHAVMRVGERLTYRERVTAVSDEKRTALGVGHFVTTVTEVTNQNDRHVATHENVLYRYDAIETAAQAPAKPARQESPPPGDLPVVTMPVTVGRCVLDAATTRDFFPGHHDREYAQAQGARDVYLNTMFYHGFVDRVVTDWSGPESVILRRELRMLTPACAGDALTTSATIAGEREERGRRLSEIDLTVYTAAGKAAAARITVATNSSATYSSRPSM